MRWRHKGSPPLYKHRLRRIAFELSQFTATPYSTQKPSPLAAALTIVGRRKSTYATPRNSFYLLIKSSLSSGNFFTNGKCTSRGCVVSSASQSARDPSMPQDSYQLPAVKFIIDNRVESALVEVRSLLETFQRHVQVVFRAGVMSSQETVHHAGLLVRQMSPDVFKWYMAVSGIDDVSFLRFELTDVHCSSEMVSTIAGGNLYDFQMLEQHIWDIYWLTSRAYGTPVKFNIIINAAGHPSSPLRTTSDQQSLRSTAAGLIAGRVNIELEDHKTTGEHRRVYSDVCGVVIDERSASGWVVVTGNGFPYRQVRTGEGVTGNPFL
ncbi:uncharacterized protein RCO7_10324 [Rhynchosporium graminicola]|uniref:Uncharacterized protein n=1 Tax=Rhynchosporium graminicola TaxID=2792576 RepID=A0A1E1KC64_9HELO|nr:uncharacterized protein RCO7_10324 [Rhynchosporium commune]